MARVVISRIAVEWRREEHTVIATMLIVVLVMAILGALPKWPHSRIWDYAPTRGIGLILVVVVILLALGRI
jgi:Protein of unknown function (DUF3309)